MVTSFGIIPCHLPDLHRFLLDGLLDGFESNAVAQRSFFEFSSLFGCYMSNFVSFDVCISTNPAYRDGGVSLGDFFRQL